MGKKATPAGRIGDKPSVRLAKQIQKIGFKIDRLKTGTPPRIDKKSINFTKIKLGSIPTADSVIRSELTRYLKVITCGGVPL